MSKKTSCAILSLLLGLVIAGSSEAANSPATTMHFGEMCGGCVKRITAKLQPMPEIGSIQPDIKSKTITVTAKPGKVLSPRVLWEAMEAINKTPKRLVGPGGAFTSKPAR
jgi:hypothetical protein